ncbi:hypothetical protein SACE_3397 [Saccharopolyspora erythraea NRRL 2338]|uniref:Uncharacterized protein n=1 Tax=Saccharopolyspora erythraea (strain ATCC 11635 / DSM 40517 / JCM 4748 / NBRC 13426 / NCIMB 8594 / NRRL 2338) TaxID=405948 RepID=A4FF47_SACEN|nr:hypothetical protein SACE_3397 [Saccharopolyspora erythraea NRRL 2338]
MPAVVWMSGASAGGTPTGSVALLIAAVSPGSLRMIGEAAPAAHPASSGRTDGPAGGR